MIEDSMILDIEAEKLKNDRIRLKFVAVPGGCGPEIIMSTSLAHLVKDALSGLLEKEEAVAQ